MTVKWLCTAFHPITNAYLGSVPLGNLKIREGMNAALDVECAVDLARGGVDRAKALEPGRSKLLIQRLSPMGNLAWSALVWSSEYDGRDMTVKAAGVWSAFGMRELTVDRVYDDADQFVIARALLDWAQAQPGGSLRLQLGGGLSGVRRDRSEYKAFQGQRVGVLVNQLASVINGFEFEVTTTVASGVPSEVWTPYYPRVGRSWPVSKITFVLGRGLGSFRLRRVVPTSAMWAIGAGEGSDMKMGHAERTDLIGATVRVDGSTAYKDVSVDGTLAAHAAADLRDVNEGEYTWSLTMAPDVEGIVPLTSWRVGDDVKVKIEAGDDYLYPTGLEGPLRVVGREILVSDDGAETVTVETGAARG